MNRDSLRSKAPANFSESTHHRLNMYALAAGAAGVGMLALAQPAEAKIVYTKANEQILGQGSRLQLDLNHDGINDFFFRRNSSAHFTTSLLVYTKVFKNDIWGTQSTNGLKLASALRRGFRIGPSKHFSSGFTGSSGSSWGKIMWKVQGCGTQTQTCTTHKFGPWGPPISNRYLGLQFRIKGKRHYGWARVSWINGEYTLTGYAYETIPNQPIIAGKTSGPVEINRSVEQLNPASLTSATPEPATLGLLAMGSPTLSIWRRKESAETAL